MIKHIIPASVPQIPLERYIKRAWPMMPLSAVRNLMQKRDVKRAGARLGERDIVRGGDELEIYLPDKCFPDDIQRVFEDEHLFIAVKPQGLPVDVDRDGIGVDTLLARVQKKHPGARLCHRLDAATGGLVMLALDETTYAQAYRMFEDHKLRKRYVALLKGGFEKESGTLKAYLVKDAAKSAVRVTHENCRDAKPIETRYKVLDEARGIARAELEPVTGRTHQLRAHMADFGHPILGDDKYGDRKLNHRVKALCLWCADLAIDKDSPLIAYRGRRFISPRPEWWNE